MIPITCNANLPPSLSFIDHEYMQKLKAYYSGDVISPKCSYKDFVKQLQDFFSLTEKDFTNLDPITYASLDSHIFSTDDMKLWILPLNNQSQIFYNYFHQRFYEETSICVMYKKSMDYFTSNCSMLESYLTINRGINKTEVEQDTEVYHNYLNIMCLYNQCILELKNN